MFLRIFNPEHDMALAADSPHWTSPHAGRQLRADLGWIPALWAEDGDVVVVDDVDAARSDFRRVKLPMRKKEVVFLTLKELPKYPDRDKITSVDTWGWDKSIKAQLKRAGVKEHLLPTDSELDDVRKLSGRQLTMELLPFLRNGSSMPSYGEVFKIRKLEEILDLKKRYSSVVVKAPWSCSGRGVRYLLEKEEELMDNQRKWILNQLKQQGELMVEPLCRKFMDFGMEFVYSQSEVEYLGLSLFSTTNGAYTGNILATEEEKRRVLCRYISEEHLDEVKERICTFMSEKLKEYGLTREMPFGVDMMICYGDNDEMLLNPCIELNFRRTMGHTALALSPSEAGHKQIMRIGYEGKAYHLRLYNNEDIFV